MAVVYMAVVYVVLTVLAGYFLGCVNGALLVSKYILHDDVRDHGSGNAGLTNFHRVFGGKLTHRGGAVRYAQGGVRGSGGPAADGPFSRPGCTGQATVAGLSCMLGHMFPCMFQFKGGKGILSGGAIALMMDWRIAVVVWGLFLVLVALTRMVSVGSLAAGVAFAIMTAVVYRSLPVTILGIVIGVLVVWGHRSNIGRILRGAGEHPSPAP